MATDNEELLFNNSLCARVKKWREEKGITAAEMALALGVPAERYRKYETRSPIPAYLMHKFCIICDASLDNLLLGTPRARPRPFVVSDDDKRRA